MIPDGVTTVVIFGLLVAPGLTFEILRTRRRPAVERTAFQEAGRTVLASAAFTAIAGLILAWAWVRVLETDPVAPLPLYATVGATAVLACALVFVFDWVVSRGTEELVVELSAWHLALHSDCPEGYQPIACVTLMDGTRWQGQVKHYTAGDAGDDRDLVLWGALKFSSSPEVELERLNDKWERVVLKSSQMRVMQIGYALRDS